MQGGLIDTVKASEIIEASAGGYTRLRAAGLDLYLINAGPYAGATLAMGSGDEHAYLRG